MVTRAGSTMYGPASSQLPMAGAPSTRGSSQSVPGSPNPGPAHRRKSEGRKQTSQRGTGGPVT
eukprot:294850-Prorocentrum_minimum.AAC.1